MNGFWPEQVLGSHKRPVHRPFHQNTSSLYRLQKWNIFDQNDETCKLTSVTEDTRVDGTSKTDKPPAAVGVNKLSTRKSDERKVCADLHEAKTKIKFSLNYKNYKKQLYVSYSSYNI